LIPPQLQLAGRKSVAMDHHGSAWNGHIFDLHCRGGRLNHLPDDQAHDDEQNGRCGDPILQAAALTWRPRAGHRWS
jgi:hypothetical protein